MRRLLLVALVVGAAAATFRPSEAAARFRERNEEKIRKAILDADNITSSEEKDSGEHSELAGEKRDPDDSIQKAALAKLSADEKYAQMDKHIGDELSVAMESGLLGEKKNGFTGGPFDYLMFTMIYPTATCMADDDQKPGSCEIPSGTKQWTIHGLWPNYADGSYPQFCDHQKFDAKQVEVIHEQMRTKWPNLFPKTPEDQLWSHEWEKHGTCSKSDPLLDSQLKYFNTSLFLLDHIDLATRIEQKGVSPRTAPYERDTLQKTLDEVIGHKVQMNCLFDKKTHESLLADIRVCMNRELKPIDCPAEDVRPYVRAGSISPVDDHQPLPVPRKCADSLYYIPFGTDLSKTIDVLPVGDDEEVGKKLDTDEEEDDDDYYGDEEEKEKQKKGGKISEREQEELARTKLLGDELMEGLRFKTEKYQQHIKHHSMEPAQMNLELGGASGKSGRDPVRIHEMARKFQEARARSGVNDDAAVQLQWPDDETRLLLAGKHATRSAPLASSTLYFGMACLTVYILVILAFFIGRRNDPQPYGRLDYA